MQNWKSKLFGDNAMNFYGWLVAGVLLTGASLRAFWLALVGSQPFTPFMNLFIAIYLILIGLFALVWQNYMARLAEKLDAQEESKTREAAR